MKTIEKWLKKTLKNNTQGLILAAHGVSKTSLNPFLENVHITEKCFLNVVNLLERVNVEFATYDNMKAYILGNKQPQKAWVHFTFDDGYKNNLENVLPILDKKNIPFTVFVSTYHVETQNRIPSYYTRFFYNKGYDLKLIFNKSFSSYMEYENYFLFSEKLEKLEEYCEKIIAKLAPQEFDEFYSIKNNQFLSINELKSLSESSLVTIASHSHHHIVYHEQQNLMCLKKELLTSFEKFKNWNVPFESCFCYPNGGYSPRIIDLLKKSNVELAFSCESDFVTRSINPLEIPRFWISSYVRCLLTLILMCLPTWFFKTIKYLKK
ncbi:MAG: polysaccharide deacetylase family protein [Bdellovibrionales bacterium]|nr:polysaccharide deacetylase family protein [Bdellovibrionales bacterium]